MDDIIIKIFKFIGFLIWVAALLVLATIGGWIGFIVGLVISGGAVAIFSD